VAWLPVEKLLLTSRKPSKLDRKTPTNSGKSSQLNLGILMKHQDEGNPQATYRL
jgi:hypothetical protein